MLKFDLVKFEAQDVITASGVAAAPKLEIDACTNPNGHSMSFNNVNGTWKMVCSHCGLEESTTGGTVTVKP